MEDFKTNLSVHESNILDIAQQVVTRSPQIKYGLTHDDTDVHVSKKLCIDSIKKYFVNYLQRYVENPDHLISIRWFYTQKLLDFQNIDPLLPYNTDDNEGLHYELSKMNVPTNEIELLVNQVHNMIRNFNPRVRKDVVQSSYKEGIVILCYGPLDFQLHENSYKKLIELYQGVREERDKHIFELLCRYESLASPGYHLSIPATMARLLRDELQVQLQLFASPFNCDSDINYCSAYPDIDYMFGAQGNFFSEYPKLFENGGSFEANPPFLEEHMAALSLIIEKALSTDKPFSFVVVYPTWDDAISYKMLLNSKYNILGSQALIFDRGDHSYLNSSQYWSRTVNRKSNSSSTIFILQNEKGRIKYPVGSSFIVKLKDSFN